MQKCFPDFEISQQTLCKSQEDGSASEYVTFLTRSQLEALEQCVECRI